MKKLFASVLGVLLCCAALFAGCSDPVVTPSATPESMEISGMKTEFVFGDKFTSSGLKVVVSYSDDTTAVASPRDYTVDSSAYDATAEGDYTIVVGLNGTALFRSYTVTVKKTAGGGSQPEDPKTEIPLDLWILAGQSNAAGYSQTTQRVQGQNYDYRELLRRSDGRTATGYDVLYYGATDVGAEDAMPAIGIRNQVGLGLGRTPDFIGPELGMAKGFADGNATKSAIVKYACGGTWLGDVAGEAYTTHTQYGGWASPSVVAQSGVTAHKNSGLMYTRLLATVENAITAFKAEGYVVSVKGFVWMQGEADAGTYSSANPSKWADAYEQNLKLFIADLRNAVAEIADDEAVKTRPFIIGKINSTGQYGRDEDEEKVRTAQDKVAAADSTVYAVESVDLPIVSGGVCLGSDQWHFNAGDMFTLGQRFAKAALDALQ